MERFGQHLPGNQVTFGWNASVSENRKESGEKTSEEELFLYLYRINENQKLAQSYNRINAPHEAVLSGLHQEDERAIPVIPNITKGWHEYNIRKNFDKIVAFYCKNPIKIGNIGWIELFSKAGVNVFGDYGLNR